ncbi:hypothetical protein [Nostoc sp. FACHB-133]|nr:hypothetical protein [Nostoc sp. FACHB-133]
MSNCKQCEQCVEFANYQTAQKSNAVGQVCTSPDHLRLTAVALE